MNKHNINSQHLKYQCLFHVGFNNTWLRNLDISFTNFKYLPDNLTIQGSLDIDQSSLKLPNNLKVSKLIWCNKIQQQNIPPCTQALKIFPKPQ